MYRLLHVSSWVIRSLSSHLPRSYLASRTTSSFSLSRGLPLSLSSWLPSLAYLTAARGHLVRCRRHQEVEVEADEEDTLGGSALIVIREGSISRGRGRHRRRRRRRRRE